MEILVKDIINESIKQLDNEQIADAAIDVWILMEHMFGIDRAKFYMKPDITIDEKQAERFRENIKKRAGHIPLQHITKQQEFMGYTFFVNENVLIPRQDTELLVEEVSKYLFQSKRPLKILDMCTGSGCIAISLKKLYKNSEITAVDISEKALEVAKHNCKIIDADIELIQSDLFENVNDKFDVIVSNPPYIKTKDIEELMPEVREHEPTNALDGDDDGLRFYQIISKEALKYLRSGGKIFYEIGYDQGQSVPDILQSNGYRDIHVFKDLSGNSRVVVAGKE